MPIHHSQNIPVKPIVEAREQPHEPPPVENPEPAMIPRDIAPPQYPIFKDFGRDKDLRNLLKTLQPKSFYGEGNQVPLLLEECIIELEDYFELANYNSIAQGIMARAKLAGPAKLWWKLNCQTQGVSKNTQGWKELKNQLKERYLPLNYDTLKMNKILSCNRKG